jgi:peptidoglycan L-alanyl-D-glutamate endopeptidase CwlK
MPKFSERSLSRLNTCSPVLQRLMKAAIEIGPDFTILCGFRTKAEQDAALAAGHSKLGWPKSRHNISPSMAVDIAPYPIDWKDEARFLELSVSVKRAWSAMSDGARSGYSLTWGGDWTTFRDQPHWELGFARGFSRTP